MRPFILVLAATALAGAVRRGLAIVPGAGRDGHYPGQGSPAQLGQQDEPAVACPAAGTWQFDPGGMG